LRRILSTDGVHIHYKSILDGIHKDGLQTPLYNTVVHSRTYYISNYTPSPKHKRTSRPVSFGAYVTALIFRPYIRTVENQSRLKPLRTFHEHLRHVEYSGDSTSSVRLPIHWTATGSSSARCWTAHFSSICFCTLGPDSVGSDELC